MASVQAADDDYRLPRTALPRRYAIHLRPDFAGERFAGTVSVEIDVVAPVRTLVCNALDLDISSARLCSPGGERDAVVRPDPERERASFDLPAPVPAGRYTLELAFVGEFNRALKGFFLNRWTDAVGTVQTIASTQFQSTDARRAFPCWDEPDLKAVFAVTLDVPPRCEGISNGPVASVTELGGGWRRVVFGDTPLMSTYLVAFVIGPLAATAPVDVDGVALRVVHVPGKARLARYALAVGAHALRFFSDWCGLPYPGAKLDLIAVPERGGAMENLGAAIFVESALLIDAERAAPAELERVAALVSHEIAHMWFGDLVTMRWWDGLWLNEAFATFVTVHCLESLQPAWRNWVAFGAQRERAMFVDALPASRPVQFPVRRPDEAEAMYDVLTYQKGAALLRMLETYLGASRFRDGVRDYLRAHAFGNADATDLCAALGIGGDLMAPWIGQGGFPLLDADTGADGTIRLVQRPFARAAGSWLVPCVVEGRQEVRVLVGPRPERIDLTPPVVVNPGGSGFYRVRYSGALRQEVTAAWPRLAPVTQFGLLADTWACALAGLVPLDDFLALAEKIDAATDPNLFGVIEEALNTFDHAVTAGGRVALQGWTRARFGPVLLAMGWDPRAQENPRTAQARSALIRLLGNVGEDPTVIERAQAWREPLPAGTAEAILSVAAAHADGSVLEQILAGYRQAPEPQTAQRHLAALAACRDPEFAAGLHRMCLPDLKTQQAGMLLSRMLANRHIGPLTWRFIQAHWDALLPRFFGKGFWRMLSGAGWLLQPPPLAGEVRAFLAAQDLAGMRRLADQALDSLEVRLAFARREGARLGALPR